MKHDTYRRGVDNLKFSGNLYENVRKNCQPRSSGLSMARIGILIAAIVTLLGTSTYVIGTEVSDRRIVQQNLGLAEDNLPDSKTMKFTISDCFEGVKVHSLKLLPKRTYHFRHGMLYSNLEGFLRITEDYKLESVQTQKIDKTFEKNGRNYQIVFEYAESEDGILSTHRDIYYKNEKGEILLNGTDGYSNQWPAFVNLETGTVRDALPEWSDEDFEGRVGYGELFRNGILISTIVNEQRGSDGAYNQLYWIEHGASEARTIELPGRKMMYYVENDTLYCRNLPGKLYFLDENFEFQVVSEFSSYDDLTRGLFTVRTETGELGIHDVINGELYVIDGLMVDYTDIDETLGYNASRYDVNGRISLQHLDMNYEKSIAYIDMLGILNPQTGQLQILQIENGYDAYQNGWLDENRFGVIYKDGFCNYLSIYEFG